MVYSDRQSLNKSEQFVILYHDIFSYPVNKSELVKWKSTFKAKNNIRFSTDQDYYFLSGKKDLVRLRQDRKRFSSRKLQIARQAGQILTLIPTVKFVGVTGSLAMQNASEASDIDFIIITSSGWLWTTRLITYIYLKFKRFSIRRAGDKDEKDKLCLNMWVDESDLYFEQQNIFTAHELAQIIPLINKDNTYEKLLLINNWIFSYWPQACSRPSLNIKRTTVSHHNFVDSIAFKFQQMYMSSKKSREVVCSTRAFFHPFDWGERVLKELIKRGVSLPSSQNFDSRG